jgi:hypothetical protein
MLFEREAGKCCVDDSSVWLTNMLFGREAGNNPPRMTRKRYIDFTKEVKEGRKCGRLRQVMQHSFSMECPNYFRAPVDSIRS